MTYITLTFNIQVDSYYHYFYGALQVPTCRCQLQFSHNWVAWPQGPRIRIRIVMKSFPDWPHNSLSGIGRLLSFCISVLPQPVDRWSSLPPFVICGRCLLADYSLHSTAKRTKTKRIHRHRYRYFGYVPSQSLSQSHHHTTDKWQPKPQSSRIPHCDLYWHRKSHSTEFSNCICVCNYDKYKRTYI